MKISKIGYLNIVFLLLFGNMFAQSSWYPDYVPTIPENRRVDWRNAGYGGEIPTYYDAVYEVVNYGAVPNDGIDDGQAVTSTINNARLYIAAHSGSFAVVYFQAGTYNFSSGINLINTLSNDFSNIIIKGAGSDKTRLLFSNNYTGIALSIKGYYVGDFYEIYSGFYRGDNVIYTNTQGFNIGDYAEIIDDFPLEFGNRGQIEKIIGKTGTQLILEDKLAIDYDYGPNHPRIRKIVPIKNVGIEDLKIERVNRTGLYNNTVQFTYAANCWIYGVESYMAYKHHVSINTSTHIELRGSYFHDAISHGDNGAGYGVLIEDHSTDCLVEDNQFESLRHSMMVQSAANRNVFGYNYSWNREWDSGTATPLIGTGDISVHGNYPYANLFEGNKVELIWADDWHPIMNGPYNTFVRNDITANIIYLNEADYSNTVGNYAYEIDYDGGPDFPPFYYANGSNFVLDVAAKQYNQDGSIYTYTHSQYFVGGSIVQASSLCKDFSYYLDDEPQYFLSYSPPVTWPALGTTVEVHGDGNSYWPGATIPAYQRKISGGKYTLTGPSVYITREGELTSDEIWFGNSLLGDVEIPSGKSLTIKSGYTVYLNGHSIVSTGGTIIKEAGATINGLVAYLKSGSTVIGYCPSIQSACGFASSGKTVYVSAGTYSNQGSATLAAGAFLEIEPGATINFISNAQLTISGGIRAGASIGGYVNFNFTNHTGGIVINSRYISFNNRLCYVNISNANIGVYVSGASHMPELYYVNFSDNNTGLSFSNSQLQHNGRTDDIENCNFEDNTYGVRFYNVTFDRDLLLNECEISGSTYGVYCQSTHVKMRKCNVHNNSYGVYVIPGGVFDMNTCNWNPWEEPGETNNIIYNNTNGVVIITPATGNLGEYNYTHGENLFCNTTYDIQKVSPPTIYAESNLWLNPPLITNYVDILPKSDYSLYKMAGSNTVASTLPNSSNSDSLFVEEFALANRFIADGMYKKAAEVLEALTPKLSNDSLVVNVLLRLRDVYGYIGDNEGYLNYLDNCYESYSDQVAGDLAYRFSAPFLSLLGRGDEALLRINKVIRSYTEERKDDETIAWLLLERLFICENVNQEEGSKLGTRLSDFLNELLSKYANTDAAQVVRTLYLGSDIPKQTTVVKDIPDNFDLLPSYPNPFNPSTTIKYALPQNSHAIIEVYNTLGEKITTLIDNDMEAGYHEIKFDGSNIASGIYIYRLVARSFETGREYVKTEKMMLLK